MKTVTRRLSLLTGAILVSVAVGLPGATPARAADTATGSVATAPASINGMLARDAWEKFHPISGGPAVIFAGKLGTGVSELQTIEAQYPSALNYISPVEQAQLAAVPVGSVSSVSLVYAHAPSIGTPVPKLPSTPNTKVLTSQPNGVCPDSNECDYYSITFTNTSQFNGYQTGLGEYVDAYRDDGSTVGWTWHWQNFTGGDGPTGAFHNWNSSLWNQGTTYSTDVGNGVVDYHSYGAGNGNWTVVTPCICWPPVQIALYESMYGDLCINEQTNYSNGSVGSATEKLGANTIAYDGGNNVTDGSHYTSFSSCS